ncbi:hypothetical protein PGT21_003595 [Puccinia graminis f. sp. tritici]|uniref:PX domain-containing protein n=1 Tax=Puccinia graminis f. sp. tritici TaxID=56615 RepID=A0A5B0PE50_PUCGR|nr:hypothetical protein PGT21_003595 [Puccinia graminis f. sp. tritici]
MNVAEGLHELLVIGNQSDILFGKLLASTLPYPGPLIKSRVENQEAGLDVQSSSRRIPGQKVRIWGNPKHSVIQRLIEIAINENRRRLYGSRKTHPGPDLKDLFRQYSESADIELVVAIVRSAEEPRLDKYDLERVMSASKAYKSLLAKNRNRITSSMTENIHVRLILDLKLYLRLISQEWDSNKSGRCCRRIVSLRAMEVLVAPLMELSQTNLYYWERCPGFWMMRKTSSNN